MARNVRQPGRREAAALALARGQTLLAAAADAGVHERTVRRWSADPAFLARVAEVRGELFTTASAKLTALATKAADVLDALLDSATETTRLRAGATVLEHATRLRESVDLAARLLDLERRAGLAEKEGRR